MYTQGIRSEAVNDSNGKTGEQPLLAFFLLHSGRPCLFIYLKIFIYFLDYGFVSIDYS